MKRRRLGTGFLAGAAFVVFGLAWLSFAFVRLEARSRIEAEEGEALRLALWRMDSWWTAHLSSETTRSPEDYAELEAGPAVPWLVDYFDLAGSDASDDFPVERAWERIVAVERTLPGWRGSEPPVLIEEPEGSDSADSSEPAPSSRQKLLSRGEREQRSQIAYQSQWMANTIRPQDEDQGVLIGPLVPFWIDAEAGQLAFVRRVGRGSSERLQGLLVDWPSLSDVLVEQVLDLLPEASLEPLAGDEPPGEEDDQLATLPARLVPGAHVGGASGLSAAARSTLVVSWLSALLALGAVGFTLRASERYAKKRSRFASTVTHELRTPLTTFRMYSEMLAKDMVPAEERGEYLDTLRRESDRLARLVENVLAYARLEEGRNEPRREELSLRELVARSLPVLEAHALEVGALFEWSLSAEYEGRRVVTDPEAVGQVLFNLLENACKYGRDEAGEVRIELSATVEEGQFRLCLVDSGPGIPGGERGTVFEPFERGSRGRSDPNAGVGLGLALSREVARALGGDLRIVDVPAAGAGHGAAFELCLPMGDRSD